MADKKEYQSARSKFLEGDELERTDELEVLDDSDDTILYSGNNSDEYIPQNRYDEEIDDFYENEDDEDYEDEKRSKLIFIGIGIAVAGIIATIIMIIMIIGGSNYLENVQVHVDGVLVKEYEKIDADQLDERLVLDGYDKDNYSRDKLMKSTETEIYLVQKKDIKVTYLKNEWDKSKQVVYQYKLNDVLTELSIDLSTSTIVYVDNVLVENDDFADTTIRMNSFIKIIEEKEETIEEEVEIPFRTIEKTDSTLPEGESKIVQVGVVGKKKIVYKVVYSNGVEISRTIISEQITLDAVDEIVHVGTKVDETESDDESTTTEE